MELVEKIGRNLKTFRTNHGYTQDQVADYLGVDRVMISYFENGTRVVPGATLMKLADFYGVALRELAEENPKQSRLNAAFAFRATDISKRDLEVIAHFKRIAKNYVMVKEKLKAND